MPEPNPGKMTNTSTWPGTPQPGPTAEELVPLCPPGWEQELPFAYRRQDVLCPEVLSPPGSISCISHVPNEEEEKEEEGKWGLHQPLIPITLLISNKPIIIRNEEGQDPSQELVPQPALDQGQQGWMAGEGQGHAMGC